MGPNLLSSPGPRHSAFQVTGPIGGRILMLKETVRGGEGLTTTVSPNLWKICSQCYEELENCRGIDIFV